jgi:hypothetical protein
MSGPIAIVCGCPPPRGGPGSDGFIPQSACSSYVNGFTECQRPACYSARQISMVLLACWWTGAGLCVSWLERGIRAALGDLKCPRNSSDNS